ncbi:unnamed protein product (macronuclear) [Paramecium tetraurelia]|uniref:IBB domain-containing protein n=1 Tax=Paramecium tetraurelia TaxID=5888 RepID=A0DY56_PARTE|nr:uncharacterized protein GSPATT00002941001 [Paramecium tetraurelia]CAK87973.1 unnamed protein product [Paramecium tetraurelia]|eukprot:XP_001455370.1 hypothetical protein (macronuclear) [Paramecium tetraurelia strain d4-2]
MAEILGDLLKQKRDNFRVELRRKATEELFKQKRRTYTNNVQTQLTDEIINIWQMNLVNQNYEETLNEIGLYLSNSTVEYNLKLINKHEVYSLLLNIWNKQELNYHIIEQLLKIFANLHSHNVFDDLKLLQNEQLMRKLFQLLEMTSYQKIQSLIFFLLANLTGNDNGVKARQLADYEFCTLLKKMWINRQISFEIENIRQFCWFLKNFFSYDSKNVAGFTLREVKDLLPIVLECIDQNDKEIKFYSLLTLKYMCQAKEEILADIFNKLKMFNKLIDMQRKSNDEEIQLKILDIIASFAMADDQITTQLVNEFKILDFFLQIYIQPGRSKQMEFKKIILWGLNNLCCNQKFEVLQTIVQHDLIQFMQKDENETEIIKDVLEVIISVSQLKNTDLLKYFLMRGKIADIVMNQLKLKTSKIVMLMCLKIIHNFAFQIGKHSQYDLNMAVELFISKGLDKLLNQLEFDPDNDISLFAQKLTETFLQ